MAKNINKQQPAEDKVTLFSRCAAATFDRKSGEVELLPHADPKFLVQDLVKEIQTLSTTNAKLLQEIELLKKGPEKNS